MSNLANGVSFSLMCTTDFEDRDVASKIVSLLLSLPFNVRPDKFDAYQPLKRKVGIADEIVDLLVNAGKPKTGQRSGRVMLAANADISYQIHWRKTQRPGFSLVGGGLMFDLVYKDENVIENWLHAIRDLVEVVNPSYGEVRSMAVKGWDVPFDLQKRLPDIPPISIYGKEYVELFSADKIEKAPFLDISKIGKCYWLVAHDSVMEGVPDAKRSEIRSYFGEDAFMANGRWKYNDGRAPSFDLSNSLCTE